MLPQRVRAMLTLHGATRVGNEPGTADRPGGAAAAAATAAAATPGADTAVAAAAAAMSAPATANDDHRKGKKRRPDALRSACVGWRDIGPEVQLEDILSRCSAMIGMHPDQVRKPPKKGLVLCPHSFTGTDDLMLPRQARDTHSLGKLNAHKRMTACFWGFFSCRRLSRSFAAPFDTAAIGRSFHAASLPRTSQSGPSRRHSDTPR